MAGDQKPIIVVKKKGGHGGHHGGAWKIAYADFVTAMMAFFMVMWLVNSASVQTKESIASYFRKPGIFNEGSGTPLMMGGAGILEDAFVPPKPEDKRRIRKKNLDTNPQARRGGEWDLDMDKEFQHEGKKDPERIAAIKEAHGLNSDQPYAMDKKIDVKLMHQYSQSIQAKLKGITNLKDALGEIEVKEEENSIVLEIMDTEKVSMFRSGSASISPEAEEAFRKVAAVISQYKSTIEIMGHTDGKPFPSKTGSFTNWELSANRANAARRLLETQGVRAADFTSVVGKADRDLKKKDDPFAPSNRRITLKLTLDKDQIISVQPTPAQTETADLEQMLTAPGATPLETPDPSATVVAGDVDGPLPPTPTPLPPTPTPTRTPRPTPRMVPPGYIEVPEGNPEGANPNYIEKDKVFKENPVVGPAEIFAGG